MRVRGSSSAASVSRIRLAASCPSSPGMRTSISTRSKRCRGVRGRGREARSTASTPFLRPGDAGAHLLHQPRRQEGVDVVVLGQQDLHAGRGACLAAPAATAADRRPVIRRVLRGSSREPAPAAHRASPGSRRSPARSGGPKAPALEGRQQHQPASLRARSPAASVRASSSPIAPSTIRRSGGAVFRLTSASAGSRSQRGTRASAGGARIYGASKGERDTTSAVRPASAGVARRGARRPAPSGPAVEREDGAAARLAGDGDARHPCRPTRRREIARPSPVPPCRLALCRRPARTPRRCAPARSAGMPMPVSVTRKGRRSPVGAVDADADAAAVR